MRYLVPVLLLAAALAAPPAAGQQRNPPLSARTPGECVQQANQWRTRQVTEARAAQREVDGTAILAESRRLAAECGARFDIGSASSAQLVELVALFNYTGDAASAKRALQRALAAQDLGQRQRGEVLVAAISNAFVGVDAFAGINAEAEAFAAQVDALPDSLLDLKVRAHQTLLGRYGYADITAGIQQHAQELLRLGRASGPAGRQVLVQAFTDLARAAGDYLHPDSALRVVANAEQELGRPADSIPGLRDARARYALAGTAAPPVSGELWLNPDAPGGQVAVNDGKVRLIQFTAHWCAPCRNSYPGMLRLAQRFQGQPFEVLFVTELYGTFEGKRVTEEEELAADRVYYAHHHIPFRIAVNRIPKATPGEPVVRSPLVNRQYQVSGIPQIVVVDGKGVIRQLVIGWDQGNEQRLGAFIESLLHGSTD